MDFKIVAGNENADTYGDFFMSSPIRDQKLQDAKEKLNKFHKHRNQVYSLTNTLSNNALNSLAFSNPIVNDDTHSLRSFGSINAKGNPKSGNGLDVDVER